MAERKYGGGVDVDLGPVLKHMEAQVSDRAKALQEQVGHNAGRYDFERQDVMIEDLRRYTRALMILRGEVDVTGATVQLVQTVAQVKEATIVRPIIAPMPQTDDVGKPFTPKVDLDAIDRELRVAQQRAELATAG